MSNVMNPERAAKIAAKRLGVSVEEYEERRDAGEKWCSGCQEWHRRDAFSRDLSRRDGLNRLCRQAQSAYMRAYLCQGTCAECGSECYGWGNQGLCAACYQARAARRAEERAIKRPYQRLSWAIVVAARLQRRWQQRAKRLFVGLAKLAAKLQRARQAQAEKDRKAVERQLLRTQRQADRDAAKAARHAERETFRALHRAERERIKAETLARKAVSRERTRAAKAARWWQYKPHPTRALSLDAPLNDQVGSSDWYDIQRLPSMLSAADELLRDESSMTLQQIVGDMTPEDVARMRAWDLDRLRERLAAAGFAPEGVQDSERDRLRAPNRHAGSSVVKSRGHGGGKRSRKAQQQVTRDHHVREMTQRDKQAHKQRRELRRTA